MKNLIELTKSDCIDDGDQILVSDIDSVVYFLLYVTVNDISVICFYGTLMHRRFRSRVDWLLKVAYTSGPFFEKIMKRYPIFCIQINYYFYY